MNNLNIYIQEKLKINSKSKVNVKNKENWSIEDAEDGDIIAWNGDTLFFIYKCLKKDSNLNNSAWDDAIVYHATYIADNRKKLEVGIDTGVGTIKKPELYKLATDEQCEEFYKALKDHGYKWDDNKKEIVKI